MSSGGMVVFNGQIIAVLVILFSVLSTVVAGAQIPVEVFVGKERWTIDAMFFQYFKGDSSTSELLFFHRTRASIDHTSQSSERPPQFGFTEAVSYNHAGLGGFAPVAVVQIFNNGAFTKAGMQFAALSANSTLFSWAVAELQSNPSVDVFILYRYKPMIGALQFFLQAESLNVVPTLENAQFRFTQRLRAGMITQRWQYGIGADLFQQGRTDFISTTSIGGFLRYEF